MTTRPTFKLSRLREIGWQQWDPIGLCGFEGTPDDEYDSYLLQAAGRLWNGRSEEEVADFLVSIETGHMDLSDAPDVRDRARDTVRALNEYVSQVRAQLSAGDK